LCGFAGEIDNAAFNERAAIIDADGEFSAIVEIFNLYPAGHGEGFVGGGDVVLIILFAVGGGQRVETGAVPAGDAALVVAWIVFGVIGFTKDFIGFADFYG